MASRQVRRFEGRKGKAQLGFVPVPRAGRHVLPPELWNMSPVRRSKNDDPAYRKSIWPAAKIARREQVSA